MQAQPAILCVSGICALASYYFRVETMKTHRLIDNKCLGGRQEILKINQQIFHAMTHMIGISTAKRRLNDFFHPAYMKIIKLIPNNCLMQEKVIRW